MKKEKKNIKFTLKSQIFNLLSAYLHRKEVSDGLFLSLSEDEWELLMSTLSLHAMSSVGYYGLTPLIEKGVAPAKVKMALIHDVISAEKSNTLMQSLVGKFHQLFKEADIKCLLLKGPSLAAYYLNPSDRKFLDLDIYAPGKGKLVDNLFRSKGVEVRDSFYRHSNLVVKGVSIENHHFLLDVRGRKSQAAREKDLKGLAVSYLEGIDGAGMYYPDAKFATIFNLHHALSHLIYEGISLRFILDWGLFLKKESVVVGSPEVEAMIRKHNLMKLAATMTKVLVDNMDYPVREVPEYLVKEMALLDSHLMSRFYRDLFRKYEVVHSGNKLRDRIMIVKRVFDSSWKVKAYLGESPIIFIAGKVVPVLFGQKFEAD